MLSAEYSFDPETTGSANRNSPDRLSSSWTERRYSKYCSILWSHSFEISCRTRRTAAMSSSLIGFASTQIVQGGCDQRRGKADFVVDQPKVLHFIGICQMKAIPCKKNV